jgi:hypothetical protein
MQRTRATRSHAASLPASPSGSAFQTGSAASSPLQRSATTEIGAANGRGSDYGTSTPMPLSAVPSAATLAGQLSGRSSPRGWNASRGVDSRQTQELDAGDEQDEAGVKTTQADKGKSVARETAPSSAAGSETIAGGHAHSSTAPQNENDDDDEEAQRKRQIERVLKRAQAAKVSSLVAPVSRACPLTRCPSSEEISSRATFGIGSSSPRSRTEEAGRTSSST